MNDYSRGYAAGLKAASEVCKSYAKGRNAIAADPNERRRIRNSATTLALAAEYCANEILSLPIEGEATNPGEQVPDSARIGKSSPTTPARSGPCVVVPLSTIEWLCGEKPHPRTGLWFERPEGEGAYWWRSVLRKDIAAAKEEHDAHR